LNHAKFSTKFSWDNFRRVEAAEAVEPRMPFWKKDKETEATKAKSVE
jgi:hypothetical protein